MSAPAYTAPAPAPAVTDSKSPSAAELTAELSEYAQCCLDHARKLGIDGVELSLSDSRAVEVNCRRHKLESVDHSGDFSASIRVLHRQRLASASISERSVPALLRALDQAFEISRFTETDPHYGLPEFAQMCPSEELTDLQLYQPYDVDLDQLEAMALRCEQAGFDSDGRIINSEGAGVSCAQSVSVFANSHGVILNRCSSSHHLGVMLLAKEKDCSESGYFFSRARRFDDLGNPEDIGREAARRTLERLHPRKPATTTCPVIYSAEVAGGFLEHLLEANEGSGIKRGDSFLVGQVGRPVAAELLHMRERPRLTGGLASRCYDGEGVRTRDQSFIEAGCLRSHSLDCYHARHLGLESTGNCGGVTNIEVDCSSASEADLIREAGRGLLVTDLIGFGVNITTGDYSRGATGFWFENGEIQYPVNECTVAARLQDSYQAITAIAGNRWPHHHINTGSLLVGQMTVGGTG